jgi:hypothetical protein
MSIVTFLKRQFGLDFPPLVSAEEHIEDQNRLIRQIVANLSRGNVSLQNGFYVMEEDIEKLRKINRDHDFLAYP